MTIIPAENILQTTLYNDFFWVKTHAMAFISDKVFNSS